MNSTAHLLMIEPVHFGYNAETAVNNIFQSDGLEDVQQKALAEFNNLVGVLRVNAMEVMVIKDTHEPFTPDAIFPNNWISFHEEGHVVLYPMFATNRRNERNPRILHALEAAFTIDRVIDLTHYEELALFLEGTGSMVLDRDNRIAYACTSARTSTVVLDEFCRVNHYTPVVFSAKDWNGIEIYHTNVMLSVGDFFAVVCLEAVKDEADLARLISSLHNTNKDIIEISFQQLSSFAGNMLQVRNSSNELLLLMSTQAYLSLTSVQLLRLGKYSKLIHAPMETIETVGGGSVRCMIAEIFNPRK